MSSRKETEFGIIPMHWDFIRASEYCSKVTDGTHDSPKQQTTGRYLITSKHIKGREIDFESAYLISQEDFEKINKRSYVDQWDVIISMIGEYCGFTYIERNEKIDYAVKNVGLFKTGSELNALWLHYFLNSTIGKYILDINKSGSSQPYIALGSLRELPILIPPPKEKTAIVSMLSSLDNKIDLLHRQNATLEKMAETLFRQWFVRRPELFEGEEAKEEWVMGKVTDYALHYKDSIQPQKNQSTLFFHYSIPSYDNGKNPIKELGKEIQSNKYNVPKYCILFSKLNPHKDKRVWLLQNEVEKNAISSTEFQVVLPKKRQHLYFLYGWLTFNDNYKEIASGVGGTSGSHQRIDPNTIYDFQCPIVAESLIEKYNIQIEPLFKKQVINQIQIRTLTALRDTLLPKLMSGEVRVEY